MAPIKTRPIAKEDVDSARFSAFMNGAYHADREAFLDGVHRWLMFAVIVLGASALTDMLSSHSKLIVTGLGALAGTFDLVFDLSTRARKHGYLRRDYFGQAAKLTEGSISPAQAEAAMLMLAADEEPPFYAAMALAENWASGAVYVDRAPPCRVGWFSRLTRHIFHRDGASFVISPTTTPDQLASPRKP
jgi:hypothetical protein